MRPSTPQVEVAHEGGRPLHQVGGHGVAALVVDGGPVLGHVLDGRRRAGVHVPLGRRDEDAGEPPEAQAIAERRRLYFDPYHDALRYEIARLRQTHARVALYDAHSIRSTIPRLFDGELPLFNLGTNAGAACSPALRAQLTNILADSGESFVVDGRFKGGWITRSFGRPGEGVEAVQMELACRAYMDEPARVGPDNWPAPLDEARAARTRATLKRVMETLLQAVGAAP